MKLFKPALFCAALALAGCDSAGNGVDSDADNLSNTGPANDDPVTGSISLGTDSAEYLQPIPDVEYDPSLSSERDGGTESVITEDAVAASDASGSDAGGTGGFTDGGTSDAGASDAGGLTAGVAGDTATGASAGGLPVDSGSDGVSRPHNDQFQAGTLTAADYDDQLNPHLYQRYASDYLQRVGGKLDVPYLDLSKRIAINVVEQQGSIKAGVDLVFNDGSRDFLTLKTPASGTTYLYHGLDALPEQFSIRATGPFGNAVDQSFSLSDVIAAGSINVSLPPVSEQVGDIPPQVLDIMFVIDTTGSMGDELGYLQTELTSIINAIPYDNSLINIGMTFYRDIGDEYVVNAHGFTNGVQSAQRTLNDATYAGGGDYPEAMDQALQLAVNAQWSNNSTRMLFLIADAPPHADKMRATWEAAAQARQNNIHIVPVAASGVGSDAEYLMRSIAAFTNSRYLFLTDDSGFGNPHAEPDVDCYVVTHLDNLMIRVMNSLIFGLRDEPTANDIIRYVGNYDRGVCLPNETIQQ